MMPKPSPINSSGIEPLGNRILVKPDELEDRTEGGIVIPKSVKDLHEDAASYGYIIAVGEDAYKHSVSVTERIINGTMRVAEKVTNGYTSPWIKPGDRVAFAPYVGVNSTGEDGVKYKILNDEDILAKVAESVTQTTIEGRKPLSQK